MGLQRPSLVGSKRAGGKAANGHAIEAVAEDEVLGEPVAGCEQRLFDLRSGEAELGCGLIDAQAVELPQDVDASLPLGQRGECGDEGTGGSSRPAATAPRATSPRNSWRRATMSNATLCATR